MFNPMDQIENVGTMWAKLRYAGKENCLLDIYEAVS